MYNRYIPENTNYDRVTEEGTRQPQAEENRGEARSPTVRPQTGPNTWRGGQGAFRLPGLLGSGKDLSALFAGKERGGLSALMKHLRLEDIDTGDILLLLIVLYLLVEGDDLELVIALGLVLIMGLGGDAEEGT